MPPKYLNLYHVTTFQAATKILDSKGISPAFSEGRVHVSWYVSKRKVSWAIAHGLRRHQCDRDQLAVLAVKVLSVEMLKTNRASVYCTRKVLYPHTMESAAVWLAHEEQYIHIPGGPNGRKRWTGGRREFSE